LSDDDGGSNLIEIKNTENLRREAERSTFMRERESELV
jgi:hypothetical protein